MAAGSLFGVALHKGTSFPVGKVDFMDLYPLTFQEFLCALGEERFVNILQGTDTDMVTTFKSKYIDRLREYYYVGGMPEVVQTYVETKDFNQVREIQKNLLNYYQQDFSKHAETSLVPRLNLVWNSIPMQLAKKNKKYIYGQVRKGSRAKDFELAIQWLLGCGLIHKVQRAGKNFDYSVGSESGGKFEGKSLKAFWEKHKPKYAVRTSMSDYREQEWMTNIPLYNIDRIKEYLEQ